MHNVTESYYCIQFYGEIDRNHYKIVLYIHASIINVEQFLFGIILSFLALHAPCTPLQPKYRGLDVGAGGRLAGLEDDLTEQHVSRGVNVSREKHRAKALSFPWYKTL